MDHPVGAVGVERLRLELSTSNPREVVKRFHNDHGLKLECDTKPPIEFLDLLGVSRSNIYCGVMTRLREQLVSSIAKLPHEQLDAILEQTFPFISVDELQVVPFTVLERHPKIPRKFLTQLAANRGVYVRLPVSIKQQVWQRVPVLFEEEARKLFSAYDRATADMAEKVETASDCSALRKKRASIGPLVQLMQLIGTSVETYQLCTKLIQDEFSEQRHPTYCALRADTMLLFAYQVGRTRHVGRRFPWLLRVMCVVMILATTCRWESEPVGFH